MGTSQSLPLENRALHELRRSSSINSFSGDKHKNVAEYPPLVVVKDASCQTNETHLRHDNMFTYREIVGGQSVGKWMACLFTAMLLFLTVALFSKTVQSAVLYMNILNFPLGSLTDLNRFGLHDARNIYIRTADGLHLNGWHLLPAGHFASQSAKLLDTDSRDMFFDSHLQNASVIVIYFHGNAANRALLRRVAVIRRLSAQLNAHVITFDYRGFGDSEGWPSEQGTAIDAQAVWAWLEERVLELQVPSSPACPHRPRVFLYGHSLGAAIATELASHLASGDEDGCGARLNLAGLILDSTFSSVGQALQDFPYILPLRVLPFGIAAMQYVIQFRYSSDERLGTVRCPVLLLHGQRDRILAHTHSERLLQSTLQAWTRRWEDLCGPSSPTPLVCADRSLEGGDGFGGEVCVREVSGGSGHGLLEDSNVCAMLRASDRIALVRIPNASHEEVFESHEWLVTVPEFVENDGAM